jgi:hypothetical protein
MSDPDKSGAELTPEARMIIGRARTSFLFTIGLLIVGFIAIAGALVYRSSQSGGSATAPNEYGLASVSIPAGAEVISASASGGVVTVTFSQAGATRVRIFDGKTGALVREFPIEAE